MAPKGGVKRLRGKTTMANEVERAAKVLQTRSEAAVIHEICTLLEGQEGLAPHVAWLAAI